LFISSAKLKRAKGFNIHKMFIPITFCLLNIISLHKTI
jgi:hypothetical protein